MCQNIVVLISIIYFLYLFNSILTKYHGFEACISIGKSPFKHNSKIAHFIYSRINESGYN